jgi:hypothetical protein
MINVLFFLTFLIADILNGFIHGVGDIFLSQIYLAYVFNSNHPLKRLFKYVPKIFYYKRKEGTTTISWQRITLAQYIIEGGPLILEKKYFASFVLPCAITYSFYGKNLFMVYILFYRRFNIITGKFEIRIKTGQTICGFNRFQQYISDLRFPFHKELKLHKLFTLNPDFYETREEMIVATRAFEKIIHLFHSKAFSCSVNSFFYY